MSILVNHVEISEEEIAQEMQYHPAPGQQQAWRLAAQSLVVRQLLLQQAVKNELCQADDLESDSQLEEKVIDQLLQHDVSVPEADEATCQRFYDTHPESFVDSQSGERQPFSRAQAQIRDYMHTKAMRIAVSEYIKTLAYSAKIKGFDLQN